MSKFGVFSQGCSGGGGTSQTAGQNDQKRGGYRGRRPSRSSRGEFNNRNAFSQRNECAKSNDNAKVEENEPILPIKMPEGISHPQLVRQRLTPGTIGVPIEIISNFYKLMTSDILVYRYAFSIKAAKQKPVKKDRIFVAPSVYQLHEQSLKHHKIMLAFIEENGDIFGNITYAFDAWKHSLCTTKPLKLPSDEFTQKVRFNGKNRGYTITIQSLKSNPVRMAEASEYYRGALKRISRDVLIVIETIFRHSMAKLFAPCLHQFFDFNTNEPSKMKIFNFHEFIRGFVSDIRRTEFGLALNLHLRTGCIISKSYRELVHFVSDIARVEDLEQPLKDWQIRQINNAIRDIKIYDSTKEENIYDLVGIVHKTPNTHSFVFKKEKITMNHLFGCQLKNYPLVQIKVPPNNPNKYLPMEHCCLVDKQFLRRMHPNVKAEYEEKKEIPPPSYFNTAQTFVEKIAQNEPELMKEFGLQVVAKPTSLYGRVLPAPKLLNCGEEEKFYRAAASRKQWALINFDDNLNNINIIKLELFHKKIIDTGTKLNLNLGTPAKIASESIKDAIEVISILERTLKETVMRNVEFLLFAIPRKHKLIYKTNDIYNLVYHQCNLVHGIPFQCFDSIKVFKTPDGCFDSILQKINTKLGGQNVAFDEETLSSLPFDSDRTMIVGVHVKQSHPELHSAVASMVGTYDRLFAKYNASIRIQKAYTEIISDIEAMFDELLTEYYRFNGRYPTNVIVLRNAVTNNKLMDILNREIPCIQRAINKTRCRINLCHIVVNKRAKARFAVPMSSIASSAQNFNVPSGTVIDTVVVDPVVIGIGEFYLVSHSSEQGTSNAINYKIFRDDLHLSTDKIQQLPFILCHNSARTRKILSKPIALQYADLFAERSTRIVAATRLIAHHSKGVNCVLRGTHICQQEVSILRDLSERLNKSEQLKNLLINC